MKAISSHQELLQFKSIQAKSNQLHFLAVYCPFFNIVNRQKAQTIHCAAKNPKLIISLV